MNDPSKDVPDLNAIQEKACQVWFEQRRDENHPDDYRTAWRQAYKWKLHNERLQEIIDRSKK